MRLWQRWSSFLFLISLAWGAQAQQYSARFSIPDNKPITLFKDPGMDWPTCNLLYAGCTDDSIKVSWPDNSSKIEVVLDSKGQLRTFEKKHVHPFFGKWMEQKWIKVRLTDRFDPKTGANLEGWVEDSYLEITRRSRPPAICPTCNKGKDPNFKEKQDAYVLEQLEAAIRDSTKVPRDASHEAKLKATVSQLKPHVGMCAFNPPLKIDSSFDKHRPVLAQKVWPLLEQKKSQLPKGLSLEMAKDIDALSRVIYGEMAQCYREGTGRHHLEAVAKVAINRAEEEQKARQKGKRSAFTQEGHCYKLNHPPNESPIVAVLGAAMQFNPLDLEFKTYGPGCRLLRSRPNISGISQALCPPSDPNKYWNSRSDKKTGKSYPAPAFETEAWNAALEIATEAVIYPDRFREKTKDIKETLFQTKQRANQDMTKFHGNYRVTRFINGKKIDKDDCLVLYGSKADHKEQKLAGLISSDGKHAK